MNIYKGTEGLKIRPEKFTALITSSKGSNKKYKYDMSIGEIRFIGELYPGFCLPVNMGIIPGTVTESGNPVDVLILCQSIFELQTMVECCPVGLFHGLGEEPGVDCVLAIPFQEPISSFGIIGDKKILREVMDQIQYFFSTCEGPDSKEKNITGSADSLAAVIFLEKAIKRYSSESLESIKKE